MLVIGLLLAGAVAWLLERISQVPKDPHRRGDLLKRAQILAVAAVVAAVGLGITLAKTPVVVTMSVARPVGALDTCSGHEGCIRRLVEFAAAART